MRAAAPPFADASELARRAFFERTGAFPESHDKAAERLDAAWEDALVGGSLARAIAPTFEDPSERALAFVIARAQRGLFEVRRRGDARYLRDRLRGASFVLLPRDEIARSPLAIDDEAVAFVGRVVAAQDGCTVLPGFVFLPSEALPHLPALLAEANARGMAREALADAMLRMDHALATMSRVKAAYAFRVEALGK